MEYVHMLKMYSLPGINIPMTELTSTNDTRIST
jgi:hypothetical protein